jgi:hypothetical protein
MLLVMMAGSVLRGRVWWMVPNVLASTFYGGRALRSGVGFETLSGIALHLLIAGAVGVLFAIGCRRFIDSRRLTLLALFVAMLWHVLAYQLIWARVNPLVSLYASQPSTAIAHAMFGLALGRSLRSFLPAKPVSPLAFPPPLPGPESEAIVAHPSQVGLDGIEESVHPDRPERETAPGDRIRLE